MSLTDLIDEPVSIVIAGTIAAWHRGAQEHYYAGAGNQFWHLLHASGLTPERLEPQDDHRLPQFGIGLTDLVRTRRSEPDEPPVFDVRGFHRVIRCAPARRCSRSSARRPRRPTRARRGSGSRATTASCPGPSWACRRSCCPGPSGANNAMSVPLRTALWRDLLDFRDSLAIAAS